MIINISAFRKERCLAHCWQKGIPMLYSLIIGALAGWIASNIMNVSGGLLQNIVIGIIGSFVGSFVFNAIGFYAHGLFATVVVSVVGACLFIWLGRKLFH